MSGSILTFGTQWLGQLPDDWSQMRARYLFRERKQKSSPDDTHLTPSQKYAVLPQSEYMKLTGNRVVLNLTGSDNMKHVESGDFVIHLRSFQGGIEYSQYTGKVSNAYTVLQPKETVVPDFFRHVLKSYGFISELSKTTDQLRDGQSIKFSQLNLLEFPLPSPETQQKIADFLDTEAAQIDNLIAKQERLLELLEEKRRATITHAVTRGLNPGVELKETNIPWLGKVPVGWLSSKLGHYLKYVGSGVTPRGGAETYTDSGVKFLRSQNVHNGYISDGNMTFITPNVHEEMRRSKLQSEDVLLNITGGSIGRSTVVPSQFGEANVNQHVCALRTVKNKLDPRFLSYILRSNLGQSQIFGLQLGSNREGLNYDQIRNLVIALPDINQQLEIVAFLNMQEEKSELLKQKIQTQITLLRERRTSLISHAVTGKVKIT